MVLVLKLISVAFDLGDGAKRGALSPHQAACALPHRPSLLAFAVRPARAAAPQRWATAAWRAARCIRCIGRPKS